MLRSVRTRLYWAFGPVMVLFLAVLGSAMKNSLDNIHETKAISRDSIEAAVQLAGAQDALWRLRYGFPQFMVLDEEGRKKIVAEEPALYAVIDQHLRAYEAGRRTPEEAAALKDLREVYKRYIEARPKWFELHGAGKTQEGADWRAKTTTPFGAGTVKAFATQMELQQKGAAARIAEAEERAAQARKLTALLAVIAVALGGAAGAWLTAGIVRPIKGLQERLAALAAGDADLTARLEVKTQDEIGAIVASFNRMMDKIQALVAQVRGSASEVTAAAAALSTATQQLDSSARTQSESAASTAAAVEQVTVSIAQVAETTRDTKGVSEQACQLSTEGEKTARATAAQMLRTADSVGQSMQLIENLSRRSNGISGIVKVIRDIAEQTNLLALNAAIEAARAGEQGRGFAVVADEVRKLAERTSTSTSEIAKMIEAIQGEVRAAVENLQANNEQVAQGKGLAEEVAAILARINEGARTTMQRIHDINSAASEQTMASTDIARNVEKIAQMSEQTSAAIGQASSAAHQLESLASRLHGEVDRFKV